MGKTTPLLRHRAPVRPSAQLNPDESAKRIALIFGQDARAEDWSKNAKLIADRIALARR